MNIQRSLGSGAIVCALLVSAPAWAQVTRDVRGERGPVAASSRKATQNGQIERIALGGQYLIQLAAEPTRVALGDPAIADVKLLPDSQLRLVGLKEGSTDLTVWTAAEPNGRAYTVVVGPNVAALRSKLAAVPALKDVDAVSTPQGVTLEGQVASLDARQQADGLARSEAGKNTDNQIAVTGPRMIAIEVRFAAVSTTTLKDLGVNLQKLSGGFQFATGVPGSIQGATPSATGLSVVSSLPLSQAFNLLMAWPGSSYATMISALGSVDLAQVLAEPTLLVRSGDDANFLAGGEIPIPVPQSGQANGAIGIQYRKFGVQLHVHATVLDGNRIVIRVNPEVSELDYQDALTVQGFNIPAIRARSTDTTIELGDGQSFVLAGLMYSTASNIEEKVPGLGSLPITSITPSFGVTFTPTYNATNVSLLLSSLAGTNVWTGAVDNNWTTAGNWSLGHVPLASEDVQLTLAPTVNISGAQAVHALTSTEALNIVGGSSLDLGAASSFGANLTLTGTLQGAGAATFSAGTLNWTGGTLAGSGLFTASGGNLTLGNSVLDGRTFNNSVNATLSGGAFTFSNGAVFNHNAGTFSITDNSGLAQGAGVAGLFNNAATFSKTGGALTSSITGVQFANAGTVNANSGTLDIAVNGTHSGLFSVTGGNTLQFSGGATLTAASTVSGAGTVSVPSGTVSVNGAYTPATTTVNGGTLNFNSAATTIATLNLSAGTVGGTGDLTVSTDFNQTGGGFTNSGNLDLTSAANITVGVFNNPGKTVALRAPAGAILDGNGAANNVTASTLTLVAANGIALDATAANLAATNTTAGNVTLTNSGALSVAGITQAGGNLSLTTTGAITQSAPITVAGTSSFSAGANAITLTNAGNDFTGAVSANNVGANAIQITDTNAIQLGTVSTANNLTVNAVGITQNAGGLTVGGAATFNGGAGVVTLTTATNDFTGAVSANNAGANAIQLTDANAIQLGTVSTANNLNVTAGGAITEAGPATVTGNASFSAGANPITLNNAANDFIGAVTLANAGASDVAIRDANAIQLAASAIGRNLTVTANGAITQTGALTAPGQTTLQAGAANNIALGLANDFGSVAVTSANNATINDINNVAVNGATAAGALALIASGTLTVNGALNGNSVALTSSGGNINGAGAVTAPTITLNAVNGIGVNAANPLNVQPGGSAGLTANNTGANDIVLYQTAGNLLVGAGGATVNNTGTGGYVIGAAGNVTINNGAPASGNMILAGSNVIVAASGYTNSGDIALSATNSVAINGNLSAGNNLAISAGGNVSVTDAVASSIGSFNITAATLDVTATATFTQMRGGTTFTATIGGMTTLQGGAGVAAEIANTGPGAFNFSTGGLVLNGGSGPSGYARMLGNPDVHLTVNAGTINLNAGAGGAYAAIEAVSPTSVYVDFPNLPADGYSVNGVLNAVYDAPTASGFIAGGVPAILATNLIVTYGGVVVTVPPPIVQQQINQVIQQTTQIVSTTQQSLTNNPDDDAQQGGDKATQSADGGKPAAPPKKLPVCR